MKRPIALLVALSAASLTRGALAATPRFFDLQLGADGAVAEGAMIVGKASSTEYRTTEGSVRMSTMVIPCRASASRAAADKTLGELSFGLFAGFEFAFAPRQKESR